MIHVGSKMKRGHTLRPLAYPLQNWKSELELLPKIIFISTPESWFMNDFYGRAHDADT